MIDQRDPVLIESVRRHEGYRRYPYRDTVGVLTIGYGRNLEAVGVLPEEAEQMLLNDLGRAVDAASRYWWWFGLPDDAQRVVVEMIYQLGPLGFARFVRMIGALERGDYDAAADEMLESRWARQTPERARELAERMRHAA